MTYELAMPIPVCADCQYVLANGPEDEDQRIAAQALSERWNRWTGWELSLGITTEICGHDLAGDEQAETHADQCESAGFSWSPCQGCGSDLGGDRYFVTPMRQVKAEK